MGDELSQDFKHKFIAHFREIENKKQNQEIKQKITKENKKREILKQFYDKNHIGLSLPQESKSENKQIGVSSFHKDLQLKEHSKSLNKNNSNTAENQSKSIQNILITKFNFASGNENEKSEINFDENKENNNKNNNKNEAAAANKLFKFSDNVNADYNGSCINLLNYTNNYKNLINVNSLGVLNFNSINNNFYNSLTSNSNKKFSACKKSPSSINRERFYDEKDIDFSQFSKNLNMENLKLHSIKDLNDDSTENLNNNYNNNKIFNNNYKNFYVKDPPHNKNEDFSCASNFKQKNNSCEINNIQEHSRNSNNENEKKTFNEIIHEKQLDLQDNYHKTIFNNRKAPSTGKELSIIDANINISLNNSANSEAIHMKKLKQKSLMLKRIINNNYSQKNIQQNQISISNNSSGAYLANSNLTKLEIESKANSPIRRRNTSNKDLEDTMNIITESSMRNLNFNNNNNTSNIYSNPASMNNVYAPNLYSNTNTNPNNKNNNSNSNSIISSNNHNGTYIKRNNNFKDNKYREERKRTNNSFSIFKSEDMRVSKIENLYMHNVNNNLNTNNNSIYYNESSSYNNSNNTLLNFNNNIINNTNDNMNTNNNIYNKEISNCFTNNNNNLNKNTLTSNNSSFALNNLNFNNKNNLNNLNTNSLSDYVNFNNQLNICSPLSTGSNINCQNTLTGNLLGIRSSNEKRDKIKNFVQYDSKTDGTLNVCTNTLTPSHQNSFNLNVFVSRNDSHGLLNFNNNNKIITNYNTDKFNDDHSLINNSNTNTINNNYNLNTDKNSNLNFTNYLNENTDNNREEDALIKDEDEIDYSTSNKVTNNNVFNNKNIGIRKHLKNYSILGNKVNTFSKQNIDKISDISIYENNDLNEDCVENQKLYAALKYNTNDLVITCEIELEFSNEYNLTLFYGKIKEQ